MLKIDGRNIWFWDIIDDTTRFLLASHFSISRTSRDANILVSRAIENSTKEPAAIITDKLRAYLEGIWLSSSAKHIRSRGFTAEYNTNLIERFHGTLKGHTKIMRGMESIATAKLIMGGWLIHYNFFRPHESLRDITPGQVAKANFPFQNWEDVVANGEA